MGGGAACRPQAVVGETPSRSPQPGAAVSPWLSRCNPSPATFRPSVFFSGPAVSPPGSKRKLWRWIPPAEGWKYPRRMPWKGYPLNFCWGRGRGGMRKWTSLSGDYLDSQLLEGRESKRGILGGFPGTRSSRGGSPCLHTPVTMTVQPQPPVSMAAASAKRLVSFLFLPGLRPITPPPTQHSPSVHGEGQLRRRRPLRHSWAREGRQESRNWRAEL